MTDALLLLLSLFLKSFDNRSISISHYSRNPEKLGRHRRQRRCRDTWCNLKCVLFQVMAHN